MAGVGITIYSPSGSGTQQQPSQVIFTTKYAFAKLDTQLGIDDSTNPPSGPISFQNLTLFFNTDPPAISGGKLQTLIYQFPHGYTYIPTFWVLFQNSSGTNTDASNAYGSENSIILSTQEAGSFAQLIVWANETNFYIYVLKVWDGIAAQPNIIGFTLNLRFYIFVEPILLS